MADRNTGEKKTVERQSNQKTKDKMAVLSPHLSIITLNVNGLNSPIKRHGVVGWIKKQDPTTCYLQETHLSSKDKHMFKVKGWKMILQANDSQKRECSHTHIRQNRLQAQKVTRDKNEQYIIIKGKIH